MDFNFMELSMLCTNSQHLYLLVSSKTVKRCYKYMHIHVDL